MDDRIMQMIGELEDQGVIQLHGMMEDDAVFAIDMDKLKDAMPMLYASIIQDLLAEVDEALLSLWEKGMVDIEWNENLEPKFTVTEAGQEAYKKIMGNLEDL